MTTTLKTRLYSSAATLLSLLAVAQEGLADTPPGLGGPTLPPASVPEPGTLALFAAAAGAALAVRWAHNRRKGD